ncbi:hypothetical protein ONZ45_g12846 [Pleurotus djamor]|nr:hypothetical protein ONZ45_g12846 [Pleurotus djamor]
MRTFYLSWVFIALPAILFSSVAGVPLEPDSLRVPKSKQVASAWYAGWHSEGTKAFPLDRVPWKKYTSMKYAFAVLKKDGSLDMSGSNPGVLPEFVRSAKENGVTPLISIGGWTGSRYFSNAVGSPENRTKFVKTIVSFVKKYQLAGVDFDWEYPGKEWGGCNKARSEGNARSDSSNFVTFLQDLRRDPVGSTLVLTAAVPITPYDGLDVFAFSQVLDHIAIMNYDIWGTWSSTVGPNAPLADSCAAPGNQQGSAESAIIAWTARGFPISRIVLGVPAYGHSFSVKPKDAFAPNGQLVSYPPFHGTKPGDAWDDPAGTDECGNYSGPGGNYNFWGIIEAGLMNSDGTPKNGVPYRFDTCSQTAYVYDQQKQVMISFDDVPSFKAKGQFIKDRGLLGFSMWEAGGDQSNTLLNAIRKTAGFS